MYSKQARPIEGYCQRALERGRTNSSTIREEEARSDLTNAIGETMELLREELREVLDAEERRVKKQQSRVNDSSEEPSHYVSAEALDEYH